MFFDKPTQDDQQLQHLCDVARAQRKLLELRFDWHERKAIPPPVKRGLFGTKPAPDPVYEQRLAELERCKQLLASYRRKMGYPSGTFWWTLPWEQVESYLIYDLTQTEEVGSWRFAHQWSVQEMDGCDYLFLQEEGHFSNFSTQTSWETGIISNYSQAEIDEKMRDFRRCQNNYDMMTLALAGDSAIHSTFTGADYNSAADYLMSAEHYLVRSHQADMYARTLYTETETTTTYVTSQSCHYKALFAVAGYRLDGHGQLQQLNVENFRLCGSTGSLPHDLEESHTAKDAAVACAAYLADCRQVLTVPAQLFGRGVDKGSVDHTEALRQAELYTCLADKLTY